MLTAYNLNPDNDAVYAFFEKDNIWSILDVQRYEPSHSAFLAWFFSQKSIQYSQIKNLISLLIANASEDILKNNWNKTPDMQSFANSVLTNSYSIKTASVTPELLVNKISKIRYPDRIDIYIKCGISIFKNDGTDEEKSLEIIIENKVDSKEGSQKNNPKNTISQPTSTESAYCKMQQTNKYYYACSIENGNRKKNDVDYQLFVFLTPQKIKCSSNNYILISYQDLVDSVLENYLKQGDSNDNTRSLINAYIYNLGNPFNKSNKEIIAMGTEEKDLLVAFYNRNKQLFETTIQAMIQKSEDDGDSDASNAFKDVADGLKKSRAKRRYTINNDGNEYMMHEIIAKYVEFKLANGEPDLDSIIKSLQKNNTTKFRRIFSDDVSDVAKGSGGKQPRVVSPGGNKIYITTELSAAKPEDNFNKFLNAIKKESGFKVDIYK